MKRFMKFLRKPSRQTRLPHVASAAPRDAFTLIELLVVISVFLLLAAIALPTFRTLLSDQKVGKSSRTIIAYMDEARSRAIAEGRFVGVRLERFSNANTVDFATAAGIRLRQLVGVPPYSGESASAKVQFIYSGGPTATLHFRGADSQLLMLYTDTTSALYKNPAAPITDGDIIELPGGRVFSLTFGDYVPGTDTIPASISLASPFSGSNTFPAIHQPIDNAKVSYKIHRSPVVSTSQSLMFPRGIVIDMNYSGIGIEGNQFAPQGVVANQPIDIIFGPDGRVETSSLDSTGTRSIPSGLIFLCVGNTDGVQPATLFSNDPRSPANLMDPRSVWIVTNPTTGRSVAAPMASVSSTSMPAALREARSLAILSDTLDASP